MSVLLSVTRVVTTECFLARLTLSLKLSFYFSFVVYF